METEIKFNDEFMEKALVAFKAGTGDWGDIYDKAPEKAKKRLRIAFWFSTYQKDVTPEVKEEYRMAREATEKEMTLEDAEYLAKAYPPGAGKEHYTELSEEIRYRPLMTPAKLNGAMDTMVAEMSENDREMIKKTREILKGCEDPLFSLSGLWKAVGGDGDKAELVGDIFDHGHGVDRDEELALYWFKKAALCGQASACERIVNIIEEEDSPNFSVNGALFWLHEGLRRRSRPCMQALGRRLVFGEGIWAGRHNPALGYSLLSEAIKDDEWGYAHYDLGRCYEEGLGCRKSLVTAWRYYRRAKERGLKCAEKAIERIQAAVLQERGKEPSQESPPEQ